MKQPVYWETTPSGVTVYEGLTPVLTMTKEDAREYAAQIIDLALRLPLRRPDGSKVELSERMRLTMARDLLNVALDAI